MTRPRFQIALSLSLVICLTIAPHAAAQLTFPDDDAGQKKMNYKVLQDRPDRMIVALPNRMILIAQEMKTAPVVSAQVWIKTGSIYEQEHIGAGLSHFLEHLLAGGTTENRSEKEITAQLGAIGAQFNAATGLASVHYYINTTSDHADTAIDLISDWMQNATIPEFEYKREQQVIQREFEFGQGSSARIFWKLTQQARYNAHPARHPTIGYLDEFMTITRDEIYDFYKRMYVPNNMVFVVVGDIDRKKTIEQLVKTWHDQPAGDLPDLKFPKEGRLGDTRTVQGKAAIDKPRLRLAWPSVRLTEPGDYELDLLATILGQGESSRLVRSVRDQARAVNTIDAYHSSFHWGDGFFGIDAELSMLSTDGKPADPDAAIEQTENLILDQIAQIAKHGVTEIELQRAKRKTLAAVLLSGQTASGMASRLARDVIGTGDPDYLERYVELLEAIEPDDVKRIANKFVHNQPRMRVILLPLGEGEKPTFLERTDDAIPAERFPHDDVEIDNKHLVDTLVKTAGETDVTARGGHDAKVHHFTLSNGLRLLVQQSSAVPAVAMQSYQLGGLLSDEPGAEGIANAASVMKMRGTKSRTAQQIARQLEDLGASMATAGGYNSSYAQAVCLKDDWPAVAELLADVVLNPNYDEDEWTNIQRRLRASIARQKDSWSGEAQLRFREAYYKNHPWQRTPIGGDDTIAKLTAEQLKQYHLEHIGADQTVVAVVGDVDPDQVKTRFEKLFQTMPTNAKKPFDPPLPGAVSQQIVQETSNKPLAAVIVGFGPGVARTHPDYAGIRVMSSVMSSFPAGWLEAKLRGEGPGLVYAVGAYPSAGAVPGHFAVLFNTNAKTAPEAIDRAMSVVRRARADLVSDSDLARAKANVLTNLAIGRQTLSDRAGEIALNELYGLGDNEPQRFAKAVQSLDARTLRAICRTYLRNPTAIILSPETIDAKEIEGAFSLDETPVTTP